MPSRYWPVEPGALVGVVIGARLGVVGVVIGARLGVVGVVIGTRLAVVGVAVGIRAAGTPSDSWPIAIDGRIDVLAVDEAGMTTGVATVVPVADGPVAPASAPRVVRYPAR